ncbi:hypothetical protein GCM10029964_095920 [Kibdelosporangium lantanae]
MGRRRLLLDRQRRLHVVDLDGTVVRLTDGTCDVGRPAWTPDGERLVVNAPRDWGERETVHEDLYTVPATGGEPLLLARTRGDASFVTVGGGCVLYLGRAFSEGTESVPVNAGLWAVSLSGGEPRRLTDVESVDCEEILPVVTEDRVYVTVRNRGAVELRHVPLAGTGVELADMPLVMGDRAKVRSFAVEGDRIAAVVSTEDSAGEVVLAGRTVTDYAAELRATGIHRVRELTGTSPTATPATAGSCCPKARARTRSCSTCTVARSCTTAGVSSTKPRSTPPPATRWSYPTRAAPPATAKPTAAR